MLSRQSPARFQPINPSTNQLFNQSTYQPINQTMYRSHTCGELRITDVNKEVTLAGWVQTIRKFGAITFVDLRDRYGITQLLLNESLNAALDANPLGREFVVQAKGTVHERSNKNANISTGDIEVLVSTFTILNKSATPPF